MKRIIAAAVLALSANAQASPATDIDKLAKRYAELGQLDGTVLVADHGKIIYHKAFGLANREWNVPNTTDTVYRVASLTKQFTATLVMQLAEQGKLKLDDPIGKYVPELRAEIGEKVTLHHLLSHTSGIVDYANYPGFWAQRLAEKVPKKDFLAIFNGPLDFVPGTQGHYSSSNYTLLGWVIEKVSGKSYAEALDTMIAKPLGMRQTVYESPATLIPKKASGYTRVFGQYQPAQPVWLPNIGAGGAVASSTGDFFLLDRALAGNKLLSEASKQRMFTPVIKDDVWGDLNYAYGWLVGQRSIAGKPRLVHEHGGNGNGYRILVTRYPEEQRLVLVFLNEGNGNKGPQIYAIKDAFTRVLYGEKVALPVAGFIDRLSEEIGRSGVTAAITRVQGKPDDANALNTMAYQLADGGKLSDAVSLLELNLHHFPQDANSYDTMGELYLNAGDKAKARKFYAKAFEMDPANTNARDIVKKLDQP